jgi:hypothetical protein
MQYFALSIPAALLECITINSKSHIVDFVNSTLDARIPSPQTACNYTDLDIRCLIFVKLCIFIESPMTAYQ